MLSKQQLQEISDHLENAQNPVFFFDNDVDGLMSFILLRRKINRGKGIAIKSFPDLDANYIKRVDEFKSDYVFVLDKPLISKEFIEEIKQRNIPLVWIDHHDVGEKISSEGVYHYNPVFNKDKSNEPISYIAYQATKNKDDLWFSMAGCLSDNFLPDFKDEFIKQYPSLWKKNSQSAFEVLFESEFGKLVKILDFGLKDRTSNVVSMINLLFKIKHPSDILVENDQNHNLLNRFQEVNRIYEKFLEKAKKVSRISSKVIVFRYSGTLSLSADLANELFYRFPGKIIIVAYVKENIVTLSIRGNEDVRSITLKAIKDLPHATGGGHRNATGAKMTIEDFSKFIEIFKSEVQ